jgi:4-hydroxy-3-polyprenylbenzoate decarboxylase
MDRLVVALTGASGQVYGIRLLEVLHQRPDIETHLVITRSARITIAQETDVKLSYIEGLADAVYQPEDIGASIASGSFATRGMVVAPCSIKTLSAIANSYSAELVARAADVHLKQGRPVILLIRETPLHTGHLRLMLQASENGCILMPPVPAFYNRPRSVEELVDHTVGRALARLGIDNTLFREWSGLKAD